MPGRLVRRVVPELAVRLPVERADERPVDAAVAALEHARRLGAGEQPAVTGAQRRHLRELQALVLVEGESLARELPGLAEVGAAPDAGAVPLARGRRIDRTGLRVVHCVIDGPAVAKRPTQLPVAPIGVAFEDETALPCSDEQDGRRHAGLTSGIRELWVLDRARGRNSSVKKRRAHPNGGTANYIVGRCIRDAAPLINSPRRRRTATWPIVSRPASGPSRDSP